MVVVLWVAILLCALWVALSCLPAGWDGRMPLPYAIALQPFLWIPLAVVAIVAAAIGQWSICCVALLVAVISMLRRLIAAHRPAGRTGTGMDEMPGAGADEARSAESPIVRAAEHCKLRVMTLNCRFGRADAASIVSQVDKRHIDVLALQELTDELVNQLEQAGLSRLLPHRMLGANRASDNGGFNGLWTAAKPIATAIDAAHIPAADVPAVVLRFDGHDGNTNPSALGTNSTESDVTKSEDTEPNGLRSPITVMIASAHTKSPMRGCTAWSQGVRGLGALTATAADSSSQPGSSSRSNGATGAFDAIVLMGDLNADVDHPSFRALLRSGFTDAALSAPVRREATYPSWLPFPRITLDHVLFAGALTAHTSQAFVIDGTDHLALCAALDCRA